MKSEQLIAKKVKHHFDQKLKQVLFDVNSLEDHYDGLLIHKSDIIYLEEGELVNGYVRAGDVNMDDAVSKEFVETPEDLGMTYEEAEKLLKTGSLIALPEWEGFLFNNIKTDETLVLTKEGEITETPWEICKERNDWRVVEASDEQDQLLRDYFEKADTTFEIEVTSETLNDNPELVAEGIVVGETITVDAVEPITEVAKTIVETRIVKADYVEPIEEIIPAKVAKKKNNKKQ